MRITEQNYLDFKPSQLVRSFLRDLRKARMLKKSINLCSWSGNDSFLPCIGSLAVTRLGAKQFEHFSYLLASLGDNIRLGNSDMVMMRMGQLFTNEKFPPGGYVIDLEPISGVIESKKDFRRLRERIKFYEHIIKQFEN